MADQISFRPHARLLTMLGEQLIKSDQIALVEIVKNSYDADATHVWVDFRDFGPDYHGGSNASIVITDNGSGMSETVIRQAWMSPATPAKLNQKKSQPVTPLGRILQGEKGIGRFAVFKLGSHIVLTSRSESSGDTETVLNIDISTLDDDEHQSELDASTPPRDVDANLYLEDIKATIVNTRPQLFREIPPGVHGTRVEVRRIRSSWSEAKVARAFADLERLQPIMWDEHKGDATSANEFVVEFFRDGQNLNLHDTRNDQFQALLERAVLQVKGGHVDTAERMITFELNGRAVELSLDSPDIRGLRPFRDRFLKTDSDVTPEFECGSFGFEFYVFDLLRNAPSEHQLDRTEVDILREHRIYLYRDGVRVYPYGDPDDDWLQVDVIRGTQSARSMFSNDQTVGYVAISQQGNPRLRDKTNREGLLEFGSATGDFVALIQTVLSYLRSRPYEQYAASNRRAREQKRPPGHSVDDQFKKIRSTGLSEQGQLAVDRLEAAVTAEREVAQTQVARTQDLAGVGLSVETASHDLIAAGSESLRLARMVVAELRQLGLAKEYVFTLAASLVQRLEFVDSRFQDVQGLFVSTRQKKRVIDVFQHARKVRSMYSAMHKVKDITFEIDESIGLNVRTTEAAVLQVLINLVDNATYWLITSPHRPRTIKFFAHEPNVYVLTDNGPGVSSVDEPFIFEPFYSGKGDVGKGLGLYIAREVSSRNGFSVELTTPDDSRALPGATFELKFQETER